jgi:hypothetical protein
VDHGYEHNTHTHTRTRARTHTCTYNHTVNSYYLYHTTHAKSRACSYLYLARTGKSGIQATHIGGLLLLVGVFGSGMVNPAPLDLIPLHPITNRLRTATSTPATTAPRCLSATSRRARRWTMSVSVGVPRQRRVPCVRHIR